MCDDRRIVFSDTNVILDFIEIGRLDLLQRLFGEIFITTGVDGQIVKDRDRFLTYREVFPIHYPEPEWEQVLVELKKHYGVGVGEIDRSAAIAARNTGSRLLTRDENLIEEAIKFLDMTEDDFIGSSELLKMCVENIFITKTEALRYCDDITETRLTFGGLDTELIERLP